MTGGVDRRSGLGFTTVSEPAKQLPGSRVVRVGDPLGFQPAAVDPMTSDASHFACLLALACSPVQNGDTVILY